MAFLTNAKWNAFSQLIKVSVQVFNIVYLAKIIAPGEYGLMAIATVIINFGVLLRDLGTSAALIQRKILSFELKNTIFWLNTTLGIVIGLIISMLSPVISTIYSQPKLIPILLLVSITFPISSCTSAHLSLLERKSAFKTISFIEISSSLMSAVIAFIMANSGFGVYSLVTQSLVMVTVSSVMFWFASDFRPSFKNIFSLRELRDIFSFSSNLALFNFINYFSRNADSFIIGKFMSVSVLGAYNLAYRIMLFPIQSLTFVTTRSLFPVLSSQQHDKELVKKSFYECVFLICFLTVPMMSIVALFSVPIVNVIFGMQWASTALILKWLAPTAIIQSVMSISGAVFSAMDKTNILMRLGCLSCFLQVSAFIVGVHFDISTFAMLYFLANLLNFFPGMFFLLKTFSSSLAEFFKCLLPIILSNVFMMSFLLLIKYYFFNFDQVSSFSGLAFSVGAGCVCYASITLVLSARVRSFVFYGLKRCFHVFKSA